MDGRRERCAHRGGTVAFRHQHRHQHRHLRDRHPRLRPARGGVGALPYLPQGPFVRSFVRFCYVLSALRALCPSSNFKSQIDDILESRFKKRCCETRICLQKSVPIQPKTRIRCQSCFFFPSCLFFRSSLFFETPRLRANISKNLAKLSQIREVTKREGAAAPVARARSLGRRGGGAPPSSRGAGGLLGGPVG